MKKFILKKSIFTSLAVLVSFLFINCSDDTDTIDDSEDTTTSGTDATVTLDDADFEPVDWTTETHSKDADPDFDEVFDDSEVKRLDFVISEGNWEAMMADMTNLYGTFGGTNSGPGGGMAGGGTSFSDEDPVFVPGSVFYNGKEWYKVGLRFKGNSSLQSAWQAGILKLAFKMDFDEFEDDYPQIKNQRFYGFKKLSLKNNYDDSSFLREKVAAEVFKNSGLAVSNTGFYTLYVDHGDGPEYFGLYTLVEEVDDTLIDTLFSSDDGNLYKPEDYGASFAEGTFNEEGFEKKTNEDEADWSDIESLFSALHSDTRTTEPETWRTNLEAVFDVDTFLNYLAVNTVIQNWDTYGRMEHNYYLYNNPDNNLLTWIPWDNNEALQDGKQGGSLNLDFSDLSSATWPLIGYLYQDEVYKAKYDAYVQAVIDGPFETSYIQGVYDTYASLVEPYATSEVSGYSFLYNSSSFYSAISTLKSHASSRASAANGYLSN
ncbi:CotH kinase family protein [Maribacter polysiphoniae]|uniref:CotH kinase family protein n=1 Tax=Maribacter polysiphoniae TaxID=429344 RepID=A0A316E1Q8_9FLAO|nr:CotH kinase family protein [Maribacter polysiphoniae]MBD1259013.1 CotH kinase family protein [Maribacter polysiphoniae]PWK24567.1 CotH protein [Maribacter polysiphoniae]